MEEFEQVNIENLDKEELFVCNRCSALVLWPEKHYNFHKAIGDDMTHPTWDINYEESQ